MSLLFAILFCYIDELICKHNKSIGFYTSLFFLTNITFAFPWFVPITKSFLSVNNLNKNDEKIKTLDSPHILAY